MNAPGDTDKPRATGPGRAHAANGAPARERGERGPSRPRRSRGGAEGTRTVGRAIATAMAGLPMGLALSAVTAVWVFGAVWSFTEQSAFATAKRFSDPALLPLVLDGLAISMAGVAFAASLDARPALGARAGTALAVAASATSNGLWAAERTLGPTGPDLTTVTLGAGIPIAANIAFEVLLAELRRQVQRRRGLPAPIPLPTLRPIRLLLAPRSTFRTWRSEVLARTASTGRDSDPTTPPSASHPLPGVHGDDSDVEQFRRTDGPEDTRRAGVDSVDDTAPGGVTTAAAESVPAPPDGAGPSSPQPTPAPAATAAQGPLTSSTPHALPLPSPRPGEPSGPVTAAARTPHPEPGPATDKHPAEPEPDPEKDPEPVQASLADDAAGDSDSTAASPVPGATPGDARVRLLLEFLARDPEMTGKDAETALAEAGMTTSYRNARRLLAEARTAATATTSDVGDENREDPEPARTGTDDTVVPAPLSLVRPSSARTSTEGDL